MSRYDVLRGGRQRRRRAGRDQPRGRPGGVGSHARLERAVRHGRVHIADPVRCGGQRGQVASSASPGATPAVWNLTGQLAGTNGLESISCPSKIAVRDRRRREQRPDLDPPGTIPVPGSEGTSRRPTLSSCSTFPARPSRSASTSAATPSRPARIRTRRRRPGTSRRWTRSRTSGARRSTSDHWRADRDPRASPRATSASRSRATPPEARARGARCISVNPTSISTPTSRARPRRLCVATDLQSGRIVYSNKPLVQGSWRFTKLTDTHNALLGVTCVGSKFCVVVAHGGDIWTTTNPTGRSSAWRRVHLAHESLSAVACSSKIVVRRDRPRRQGARVLEPWCQASVVEGDDDRQAAWGSEPARRAHDRRLSAGRELHRRR